MKGVAANAAALRRGLDKAQIEVGVVAHQDGPGALMLADLLANGLEQIAKHLVLPLGLAVGVVGVDAGKARAEGSRLAPAKGWTCQQRVWPTMSRPSAVTSRVAAAIS